MKLDLPNAEAARLYSFERLVENTPESSVQMTKGCFELYRSAASSNKRCYKGFQSLSVVKKNMGSNHHKIIVNACLGEEI